MADLPTSPFAAVEAGARRLPSPASWAAALGLIAIGSALLAALVQELAAPMAAGVHHDFLAFFAAGRLVLDGRPGDLYDAGAITAIQRTVIPSPVGANGYMPFINPPFAAVAFAPIASLPAEGARIAWALLSLGMLVIAGAVIARPLPPRERVATALLIVLSFPAYHSLAEGQWSAAMLLGGVAALAAARRGSWALAGLALATWWLKPQLVILPMLALVLDRRWSAVAWTLMGGAALVVVSIPVVGAGIYVQYLGYLLQVAVSHFTGAGAVARSVWEGDLATSEGLNGMLVGFFGQGAVSVVNVLWAILVAGLVALWLAASIVERPGFGSPAGRSMIAAGVGVVLLVNPNLFIQDCVLVFLVLPALWPLPPRAAWRAVILVALLAALVLLDQPLGTHFFTIALFVVVAWLCASILARRLRMPGADRVPG